jgi:hypothetical protein
MNEMKIANLKSILETSFHGILTFLAELASKK